MLLLSFALYHGLNGVRNVAMDYGLRGTGEKVVPAPCRWWALPRSSSASSPSPPSSTSRRTRRLGEPVPRRLLTSPTPPTWTPTPSDVAVPAAKALGPARLPGYRLAFTRYSRPRRGGSADVVADDSSEVWGVLYEVDDACLASMDKVEGVPHAYRREVVAVSTREGEPVQAITYVANKTGEFRPNKSYVKVILRGARAHGLPEEYVRMLEQIETAL